METLKKEIQSELSDLRRFRRKIGDEETYLYPDRIARREEILKEIDKIRDKIHFIGEQNTAFYEFYSYLKGERNFSALGNSDDFVGVIRYFYRETVKKYKIKHGLTPKTIYPSDAYALTLICSLTGRKLRPSYSHVFVDEGQDISAGEYALIKQINQTAAFNIFGDIQQNVTAYRGVLNWSAVFPDYTLYTLNQNYRNTNQIVEYVSEALKVDMQPIGFDGDEVTQIPVRNINAFLKNKKGLKAVICSQRDKEKYLRKSYSNLSEKGKLSPTSVNYMTVYESKGLEFTSVVVIPDHMTENELYIACTRALKELAIGATAPEPKAEPARSATAKKENR